MSVAVATIDKKELLGNKKIFIKKLPRSREYPYTMVNNKCVPQNKYLSLPEIGILTIILSLEPTKPVTISAIKENCTEHRQTIQNYLNKLEELGYVEDKFLIDTGKGCIKEWAYIITELPDTKISTRRFSTRLKENKQKAKKKDTSTLHPKKQENTDTKNTAGEKLDEGIPENQSNKDIDGSVNTDITKNTFLSNENRENFNVDNKIINFNFKTDIIESLIDYFAPLGIGIGQLENWIITKKYDGEKLKEWGIFLENEKLRSKLTVPVKTLIEKQFRESKGFIPHSLIQVANNLKDEQKKLDIKDLEEKLQPEFKTWNIRNNTLEDKIVDLVTELLESINLVNDYNHNPGKLENKLARKCYDSINTNFPLTFTRLGLDMIIDLIDFVAIKENYVLLPAQRLKIKNLMTNWDLKSYRAFISQIGATNL
jgi:hypothetical protein